MVSTTLGRAGGKWGRGRPLHKRAGWRLSRCGRSRAASYLSTPAINTENARWPAEQTSDIPTPCSLYPRIVRPARYTPNKLRIYRTKFVIPGDCSASSEEFVISDIRYTEVRYSEGLLYTYSIHNTLHNEVQSKILLGFLAIWVEQEDICCQLYVHTT